MTQTLKFNEEDVKKAEKDYKKLNLDKFQREAIDKIALLMDHFLDLKLNAIKGSMWLTIRQWQEANQKNISVIGSLPRKAQEQALIELISLGKERIKKMMVDPEGQRENLDTAFQGVVEAVKIYIVKRNET
jgi:hypothetical protein